MMMRTSQKIVTFTQPFRLRGVEEMLPAGAYQVETDEELVQGLSFPVYRRVATVIFLPSQSAGATWLHAIDIDPSELDAAQERDAAIA
ncbi:hypothetical protein [Rhodospirillaceae bacterium SYSU D60014]|uniref:hypothetical protein n=1 Tax=Virgifigura deserti TaxID=2268457 RepID=UPI000E6719C7